jgi:hypothetical protein
VANNYSAYGTIVATSKSNAWALGGSDESYGNGTTQQAEAVHWNGSDWSKVTLPTAKDFIVAASAPAANDVWAVGSNGDAPQNQILHYTGSTWQKVSSSAFSGLEGFNSITSLSASNVWLTAWGGNSNSNSYLLHYNGHVFSKVKVPWSVNAGRVVSDGAGGIWFSASTSTGQSYAVHVTAKGAMSRTEVSHLGSLTTVPGTTALWSAGTADNKTAGSQAVILAYGKV